MTRWARVGLAMITACIAITPFGNTIAHEKDTPGLDDSLVLQLLVLWNQTFVKYIWGWTCLIIIPFATIFSIKIQSHSSYNFNKSTNTKSTNKQKINHLKVIPPIFRVGVFSTIIWQCFLFIKRTIFEKTGRCVIKNATSEVTKVILKATSPKLCKWYGSLDKAVWTGFNLSGHSFMLNFCTLIVLNELENYVFMKKRINSKILKCMYYVCCLFVIACQSMLLVTYLMYHQPLEKVMATVLAVVAWQVLYEDFFKRKVLPSFVLAPPAKEKEI